MLDLRLLGTLRKGSERVVSAGLLGSRALSVSGFFRLLLTCCFLSSSADRWAVSVSESMSPLTWTALRPFSSLPDADGAESLRRRGDGDDEGLFEFALRRRGLRER